VNENNQEQQIVDNWGDYNYPLACRMLKQTDAFYLYPVMKKSAFNLSCAMSSDFSHRWSINNADMKQTANDG